MPEESIPVIPNVLATNVLNVRFPGKLTPLIIAFTCGIPLPADAPTHCTNAMAIIMKVMHTGTQM